MGKKGWPKGKVRKIAEEGNPSSEVFTEIETRNEVPNVVPDNDYSYFADFDKGSSTPAWMMTRSVDMLENEVNTLNHRISTNQIPLEEVEYAKSEYKMKKERLDQIKNSMPKLTGRQKDELKQKRDAIADEIRRSKFTRLQMERGLADPHEEADRMSSPCINVDKKEAARANMSVDKFGRVSRSKAEMLWKMMSSLLGDTNMNPNSEVLRDDTGLSKRNMGTVDMDVSALPKVGNLR